MEFFSVRELSGGAEGYATGKDAKLRLGGVTLLYLPFAVLRDGRAASGFLLPSYGQHKPAATVVEVPFYWAATNNADAHLYQTVPPTGATAGVSFVAWATRMQPPIFRFLLSG